MMPIQYLIVFLCLQDDHVNSLTLKLLDLSINVPKQSAIAAILLQTLHQIDINITSLDGSGQQIKRDNLIYITSRASKIIPEVADFEI